ncbi:hypothetical protein TNCV_164581 [Trichonephila clavipes]|nr:hypothetical protein TNCV_164581 [Trichonephila clavipes]
MVELLTASFNIDFGDNLNRNSYWGSNGRPRGNPQMTDTLSYRPEETGGRQREKSQTHARRLGDRYRVLPWPEDCTVVVCLHDALDSHRILIWRKRGSRNIRTSLKGTGRRLTARKLPKVTIRELRLALQDEWAATPQQLIDTLILSMGRECETCLVVTIKYI